jgi:four helix bundle protein
MNNLEVNAMYFEFEKLDVYQAALELIVLVDEILEQLPKGFARRRGQLRGSTDSIADNIAEGVGEFAAKERTRFLRIARRSSLEAASQLLVIQKQRQAKPDLLDQALRLLHRIVSMLTKMSMGAEDRRPV